MSPWTLHKFICTGMLFVCLLFNKSLKDKCEVAGASFLALLSMTVHDVTASISVLFLHSGHIHIMKLLLKDSATWWCNSYCHIAKPMKVTMNWKFKLVFLSFIFLAITHCLTELFCMLFLSTSKKFGINIFVLNGSNRWCYSFISKVVCKILIATNYKWE